MNLSTQVAIVAAFFSLVLGVFVWISRERTKTTLPFSLLCLSISVYCSGKAFWLFTGNQLFGQAAGAGGLFAFAGFYYLLVVFMAVERRAHDIAVVTTFILAGIGSVIIFISKFDPGLALESNIWRIMPIMLSCLCALVGIVWISNRAKSETAGKARNQMIGFAMFIGVLGATYLLEKILRPASLVPSWTLVLLSLFLYFLYQTVVQYRLFGLREMFGKAAVFVVSVLFLSVTYGLLIFLIGASPIRFLFQTFVAAFLLLILYEPLLSRVESGTIRWLLRGSSEQRRKLGRLAQDLAGRIDVDEVLEFLQVAVPQAMGFSRGTVYFLESGQFVKSGSENSEPAIIRSDLFIEHMEKTPGPLFAHDLRRRALDSYPGKARDRQLELFETMYRIPAQVVFPLKYQEKLLGLWAINDAEGSELRVEAGDVLLSLADQAALRIENSRIYQRLKIKDRLATVGEMAAGLAHEIRNPLGSMKGAAEYLSDEPMPESSAEFIQIILEEAGRLNQVLGRFLDFARPFKVDFAKQDVVMLVNKVIALFGADDAASQVSMKINTSMQQLYCMMDIELIQQVLINLIKNGIESMQGDGRLEVSVTEENDRVIIDVCDEGPGVTPEMTEKLFEPFFSTKKGGTGLGLAISRRICEAHHGTLNLVSTFNKGICFRIELPSTFPVNETAD